MVDVVAQVGNCRRVTVAQVWGERQAKRNQAHPVSLSFKLLESAGKGRIFLSHWSPILQLAEAVQP